jgi:phospholipid/cholesterol/gamma-HCH transport system substrate-binding protein
MAKVLGPTFRDLRPFARRLDEINKTTRNLAKTATPALRNEIRPFVRSARAPVRDLGPAAQSLATATPDLTTVANKINRLGNMAAFNPNGAEDCPGGVCAPGRDEGYLYWAAWLAHNGNSVFSIQDAHGLMRRIYFTASCENLIGLVNMSPLGPVIGAITEGVAPLFNNLPAEIIIPIPGAPITIRPDFNPGAPCSLPEVGP